MSYGDPLVPMRKVTTPDGGTREEPDITKCERCGVNDAATYRSMRDGKTTHYYMMYLGVPGKVCPPCGSGALSERRSAKASNDYVVSLNGPIPSDTPSHRIENLRWINFSDDERRIMAAERLIVLLKQRKNKRPITTPLGIKTVIEILPSGRREERQEVVRENCRHCFQRPAAVTEKEVNGQKIITYKDHGFFWMGEDRRYFPCCDECAHKIHIEESIRVGKEGGYGGHRY